jgi:hypothetical protein
VNDPTAKRPDRRVEAREAGIVHSIARDEIVAQYVADLHRQAAKQRLLRELRASRKPTVPRRRIWERLTVRRPRPAVMTRTPPTGPVVARGGQTTARRTG